MCIRDRVNNVSEGKGYDFSDSDFKYFEGEDFYWQESGDKPVFLVMTICKLGSVRQTRSSSPRSNITTYDVGDYRLWLNACAGYIYRKVRYITPNKFSQVTIGITPQFNDAGDRLNID